MIDSPRSRITALEKITVERRMQRVADSANLIKDSPPDGESSTGLVARLGLFDATMIVMGGIVGSGIFINPYVVARLVHTPALIFGAWISGGVLALVGAFIYAELAARMPRVGGQYAYLSEALHPAFGFLYGWVCLFVINGGATAAVAVTFAAYFREIFGGLVPEKAVAIAVVVAFVGVNCLGVKAGGTVQSLFMLLRILAVTMVVACGAWFLAHTRFAPLGRQPLLDRPVSFDLLTAFGAAMVPVVFAYGGWQTANYVASEIRDPRRNLPRALLHGVLGIIALYLSVNFIYVAVLSPAGLAATETPASEMMRRSLGGPGGKLIAAAIAISTLGFLSQTMLTYPRIYYAMAQDGMLPRALSLLGARSRAPVGAILLQSVTTIAAILLGTYEQILSYVIVMDWLFFALTASSLFVFRSWDNRAAGNETLPEKSGFRVPGHPWTTAIFTTASWLIVLNTIYKYPRDSGVALCILFAGVPVFFLLRRRSQRPAGSA
jgi:basic amino acid/polyamine antiporter, APA family